MEGRWPCPQYCVATRVGGGSWALWEATGFPSISGRDLKLERATHRGVSSLSLEVYKQRLLLLWLFPALCPFLLTRRILKTCFRHSAPCPDVSQGPLLPLGSSTNPPSPRQYLTGSWSVESGFALGGEGEALGAGRAWGGQASGAREMGVRQEGQPPRAGGGREGGRGLGKMPLPAGPRPPAPLGEGGSAGRRAGGLWPPRQTALAPATDRGFSLEFERSGAVHTLKLLTHCEFGATSERVRCLCSGPWVSPRGSGSDSPASPLQLAPLTRKATPATRHLWPPTHTHASQTRGPSSFLPRPHRLCTFSSPVWALVCSRSWSPGVTPVLLGGGLSGDPTCNPSPNPRPKSIPPPPR